VDFDLLEPIYDIETIAVGTPIRQLPRLRKWYGQGRWRKLNERVKIRLPDGTITVAELHWYEAAGTVKKEMKLARLLRSDEP
jgi:hypothetical protein